MPIDGRLSGDGAWLRAVKEDIDAWLVGGGGRESTSQITGAGAVRRAEDLFSALHGGRPAVLTPSATYGMRLALAALGVKAGSDVLTPALDWPANLAAIKSLGAQAVLVPVDADTLTINPAAVRARITPGAKALIATHLHGVPADVPALRAACGPNLAIVEDCAQSLGSALDNQTVGLLGDAAVFSFGPRKQIDAGEGGMVLTRDWELQTEVLRLGAHPARQLIGGETNVEFAGFSLRPHPLTAVLLAVRLSAWSHAAARRAAEILREKIIAYEGWQVVGADERRRNAASLLPVVKTVRNAPDLPLTRESGARDLAALQAGSPPVWLAGPGIEA